MGGQRSGDSTESDAEISVVVGSEFDVVLADLPGAGFRWQLRSLPDGIKGLPVVHEASDPDLLGGSERIEHRYRATVPGSYELVFDLVRPWETTPARHRRVRISVLADSPDRPVGEGGSS